MSTRSYLPIGVVCLGLAVAACDVKVGENGLSFDVAEGRAKDEWTRTYTLPANGHLEVVNINGSITAVPSKSGQVEIVATREVRAASDEAAREALHKAQMIEDVTPDRVKVEAPRGIDGNAGGPFNRRAWVVVEYRVGIPAGLNVSLKTENGQVRVDDVNARLVINSTNGSVNARGLAGTLEAQTVNGGINVEFASLAGDVRVGTVNGAVRIGVPRDINADLEAHAVNGGVSVDEALTLTATQQERQHIVGRLGNGGSKISAQTVNGGVRIRPAGGAESR